MLIKLLEIQSYAERQTVEEHAERYSSPYMTGVGLDPVCGLAAINARQKGICHG
jgi:hypothetical protein